MYAVLSVVLVLLTGSLVDGQDLCSVEGSYEFFIKSVMENTANGTILGKVPILGNESEVMLQAKDHQNFAFNSSTREVILINELDKDQGSPPLNNFEIECRVTVSSDPRPVKISIVVLVIDWNDNAPEFEEVHHTVSLSEDASVGVTVYKDARATDRDQEFTGNSRISYTIVQGQNFSDYFQIPIPSKPDIVLSKKLDYETIKVLTVQIRARDDPNDKSAVQSATATLTVSVIDADDQNPVFTRKSYAGTIVADATPHEFVQVQHRIRAYDPDSMNVTVNYKLLDPYEIFDINETTGEVYTVRALYVDVSVVTVVVIAYQTDNPSREWFAMLTITITKANVNAPRFSKAVYHVTKLEMEPVGSTLVTTTATDPDFGTMIFYAIKEPINDIKIDEMGSLILQKSLDYETEQRRTIHVTASDGIYTATATVEIEIIDVNDNNPTLEADGYEFYRERETGLVVTKLTATDADFNSSLSFRLHTYEDLFTINNKGEIIITGYPETIVADRYPLLISVRDNGKPPRQDFLQIEVLFPSDGVTTKPPIGRPEPVDKQEPDMLIMIVLGAVAGLLLVIVLIMTVYILWRNKRVREELDKARAPRGIGPQGLTYRPAESPDDLPGMDLHYGDDADGISDYDGDTPVQQNPLSVSAMNQGYLQSSGSEMDRDVSEIEIETAVIPYEEDIGYASATSKYASGHLRTFHGDDTTSSGSGQSDSTGGSRRVLVNDAGKTDGMSKMTTWDSDDQIHPQGSDKLLDPNTAVTPVKTKKDKPEITVYF